MSEKASRKSPWTMESILKYIEENNITSLNELREKAVSIYHWIYRYKCRDILPFGNMPPMRPSREGLKVKTQEIGGRTYTFNQLKGRSRDHYDINISLPYLIEWAAAEGVTLKKMCYKMGYAPEYDEWCDFISDNLEQMGLWEMNEVWE